MSSNTSVRYPLLDLLRLCLAAEVMRCHYFSPNWMLVPCVPLFLALSGFLVPGSFEQSRNWGHFAWKRFLRIVPGYCVMLLAIAVLVGPNGVRENVLTYLRCGWTAGGYNGVVWSLGAEEVAYVLLAILFVTGLFKSRWPLWAGLVLGMAFMLIVDRPGFSKQNPFLIQCLP